MISRGKSINTGRQSGVDVYGTDVQISIFGNLKDNWSNIRIDDWIEEKNLSENTS
jgi:hypothetical protein